MEKKDPIVQLEASKWIIKNLFSHVLNEIKGFKYCTSFVKKYKLNGEIEFRPVYFNSVTKTEMAGFIELIEFQYINISTCRPLPGSFWN